MYYIGLDDPHTGNKEAQNRYTLSRVVLRKDGFTCVESDYEGGEFTTPPLHFDGKTLHLNIETSAVGLARVEIQDEQGNPLEGLHPGRLRPHPHGQFDRSRGNLARRQFGPLHSGRPPGPSAFRTSIRHEALRLPLSVGPGRRTGPELGGDFPTPITLPHPVARPGASGDGRGTQREPFDFHALRSSGCATHRMIWYLNDHAATSSDKRTRSARWDRPWLSASRISMSMHGLYVVAIRVRKGSPRQCRAARLPTAPVRPNTSAS